MIEDKIRELKLKIEAESNFEVQCVLIFDLIKYYNTFDLDESLKILKTLLKKQELKANEILLKKAMIHLAIIYIKKGRYKQSIKILSQYTKEDSILIANKIYTSVYSSLATIYADLKEYNTAIYIWDKLYKSVNIEENLVQKSIFANNIFSFSIANLKTKPSNIEEMFEFERLLAGNDSYSHILCMTLANISNYYLLEKNKEKFKLYYKKSEQLAQKWEALDILYHLLLMYAQFCNEVLNSPEDEKKAILEALEIAKNLKKENHNPILYYRLYILYYNENKYKQALKYHVKFHEVETEKNNTLTLIQNQLKDIGFDIEVKKKNNISKDAQSRIISNSHNFIILKNIKNENIKIELQNIVTVTLFHTYVKIKFAENLKKEHVFKHSIHEVYEKIAEIEYENTLFFYTNLRSEFVNLYWMSSFNNYDRKLTLDVIGSKTEFILTYRQSRALNRMLKNI